MGYKALLLISLCLALAICSAVAARDLAERVNAEKPDVEDAKYGGGGGGYPYRGGGGGYPYRGGGGGYPYRGGGGGYPYRGGGGGGYGCRYGRCYGRCCYYAGEAEDMQAAEQYEP